MSLWEQELEGRTVNPILSGRVSSFPRVCTACDAQPTLALLGRGWAAGELRESATKKKRWQSEIRPSANLRIRPSPQTLTSWQSSRISTPIDLNVFLGKEAELNKERDLKNIGHLSNLFPGCVRRQDSAAIFCQGSGSSHLPEGKF